MNLLNSSRASFNTDFNFENINESKFEGWTKLVKSNPIFIGLNELELDKLGEFYLYIFISFKDLISFLILSVPQLKQFITLILTNNIK